MNEKDPAVLLYTSDFLTGVIDMDMEERGQYITLLCYQHQRGHISEKTIRLLVGNVSDNVLSHFKKDENGLLFNSRMDLEKENRKKFTESRRENGKKGGRPKKKEKTEKKPNGYPNGKPNENHMGNENDNENDNKNIDNNLFTFIEKNFGRSLSPIECEEINTWKDNDLTRYAIKKAILKGKYTIQYVSTILFNYQKNNIKTVQQAQQKEEEYLNKTQRLKKINSFDDRIIPEWMNKEYKKEPMTPEELKEMEKIKSKFVDNLEM